MLHARQAFVSFLIIIFVFLGFFSQWVINRPVRKAFADLALIQCTDPEHSHPPMNTPESGEEIHTFNLINQESSPAILEYSILFNFPITFEFFSLDCFSKGILSDYYHSTRAPPLFVV